MSPEIADVVFYHPRVIAVIPPPPWTTCELPHDFLCIQVQQASFKSGGHGGGPVSDRELGKQMEQVGFDGGLREIASPAQSLCYWPRARPASGLLARGR